MINPSHDAPLNLPTGEESNWCSECRQQRWRICPSIGDRECTRGALFATKRATPPQPTYEELGDLATDRGVSMALGWTVAAVLAVALAWRWRR